MGKILSKAAIIQSLNNHMKMRKMDTLYKEKYGLSEDKNDCAVVCAWLLAHITFLTADTAFDITNSLNDAFYKLMIQSFKEV